MGVVNRWCHHSWNIELFVENVLLSRNISISGIIRRWNICGKDVVNRLSRRAKKKFSWKKFLRNIKFIMLFLYTLCLQEFFYWSFDTFNVDFEEKLYDVEHHIKVPEKSFCSKRRSDVFRANNKKLLLAIKKIRFWRNFFAHLS